MAVFLGPAQRRKQTVVFGDVVGRHADATVQLGQHRTVGVFDVSAVARGPGIAASAAINVGGDQDVWVAVFGCRLLSGPAGLPAKYRIRRQLSHWMSDSL